MSLLKTIAILAILATGTGLLAAMSMRESAAGKGGGCGG
jgi:hypothetical protein